MKRRTAVRVAAKLFPASLLLALPVSAKAKPPEEIVEVASGCFSSEDGSPSLKRVVKLYGESGYSLKAWGELQIEIGQLLELKPPPGSASFAELIARDAGAGVTSPVHSIVFANPAALPDETVVRVLYRPSESPDADNAGIGGTRVLYEVFLSESGHDVLESSYAVTRKEDPLLSRLTSFFVKIGGAGLAAMRTAHRTDGLPRPVSLCVSVRRVPIRFSRATVEIKDFITRPSGKLVKGETSYENVPPTRLSLDLIVAGAVGGTSANVRAKVDNRTLVEDPFDKPLTAAGVSWYPIPADPMRQDRSLLRPSVFVGATLTPDIGIALGAGLGVVKDLKVAGGYAWVRSSVPRPGHDLGAAIGDQEPLKKGLAGTFFVGLGYAF